MSIHQTLLALLEKEGVQFKRITHEPTPTSADSMRVRGMTTLHSGAKALLIEGDKTNSHWLCVMPADLRFDAKKFGAIIGERVHFVKSPEEAVGLPKGSVPPFGSLLGLQTYCDKRLAENENIDFNAASLTDSVTMPYADYERIEKPILVDITE